MGSRSVAARWDVAGRDRAIGKRNSRANGFIRSLGMLEVKYVYQGLVPHWLASPRIALKWNALYSGQSRPSFSVRIGVLNIGG